MSTTVSHQNDTAHVITEMPSIKPDAAVQPSCSTRLLQVTQQHKILLFQFCLAQRQCSVPAVPMKTSAMQALFRRFAVFGDPTLWGATWVGRCVQKHQPSYLSQKSCTKKHRTTHCPTHMSASDNPTSCIHTDSAAALECLQSWPPMSDSIGLQIPIDSSCRGTCWGVSVWPWPCHRFLNPQALH